MSDVKCGHKGCDLSAHWLPVLLIAPPARLYPGGLVPPKAISRGRVGMPVCDVHKAMANVDDFCTPEAFVQIAEGFIAKGLVAPDPDVGLDFEPLPKCGDKNGCENPAVVQIVWNFPEGGAALLICAEHVADVRRILIEHNPGAGVERQEVELVPQELWR